MCTLELNFDLLMLGEGGDVIENFSNCENSKDATYVM